jgi:carotenoid cleavage dioxygenase-like enzyme
MFYKRAEQPGSQISTAHPHSDGTSSYSYTIDMGRRSTYRLFTDKNGSQSVLAELPVEHPSYMHSFGMSEHYLILTEFPLRVNPLRLAFSSQPFIRNYRWIQNSEPC